MVQVVPNVKNSMSSQIKYLKSLVLNNKVEDMMQIVEAGVMVTPALKINGKAVVSGSLPSEADLTKIITSVK